MRLRLLHDCLMQANALLGKRILITRAAHQLGELADRIRQRGAIPVAFPCLEYKPLQRSVRQQLAALQTGDDIAFTSVNGVRCVADAAEGRLASLLRDHRIAAVGERTASCLKQQEIKAHIIPKTASQKGLIAAYREMGLPQRLIFFRAEEGGEELATYLRANGSQVITVPTYRTTCPDDDPAPTITLIQQGLIDAVMLGSAKTARHYLQRIGNVALANRPAIAVISRQVAQAAEEIDLQVQVIAKEASFTAMLDGLNDYFANKGE